MEVPNLPMIFCDSKSSTNKVEFGKHFRQIIRDHYGEDPDSYAKEIKELEALRNSAMRAPCDVSGCTILKRYFAQLHSLKSRFWTCGASIEFTWTDCYTGEPVSGDIDFELGCVLYTIGALHSQLGASDSRSSAEAMKSACTHFQCAAWAFEELRDSPRYKKSKDSSRELMTFFNLIMLAQAQECILEKSIYDNRKAPINAKVTQQVTEYLNSALAVLLQAQYSGEDGSMIDVAGSKMHKEWKKFIEFKICFYTAFCSYFMGIAAEEQQKMGERIAWFELAEEKLKEANKAAKSLDKMGVEQALSHLNESITKKLSNAKKENDFVYHEKVPTADKLTQIKGASLVKGIPFSVNDPEIFGQDIFAKLVPLEAHEAASIYSENKDRIWRDIKEQVTEKNDELSAFMESLHLSKDSLNPSSVYDIPNALIEICAAISVNSGAVGEVESTLKEIEQVQSTCSKMVEDMLQMIKDQQEKEKEHQESFGKRAPSMILTELSKEIEKHRETYETAVNQSKSLKESFEKHKPHIELLIRSSAQDLINALPKPSQTITPNNESIKEMQKLLAKVDEMKSQREMLANELRKAIENDDVIKQILSHEKSERNSLFEQEIKKFDKQTAIIKQNLAAQDNILKALTDANAKYADIRMAMKENKKACDARVTELIQSYEAFTEVNAACKKTLDLFKKLEVVLTRLFARVKSVSRVQDDERTQLLTAQMKRLNKENFAFTTVSNQAPAIPPTSALAAKIAEMKLENNRLSNVPISAVSSPQPAINQSSNSFPQQNLPASSQGPVPSYAPYNQPTVSYPPNNWTQPQNMAPSISHPSTLEQQGLPLSQAGSLAPQMSQPQASPVPHSSIASQPNYSSMPISQTHMPSFSQPPTSLSTDTTTVFSTTHPSAAVNPPPPATSYPNAVAPQITSPPSTYYQNGTSLYNSNGLASQATNYSAATSQTYPNAYANYAQNSYYPQNPPPPSIPQSPATHPAPRQDYQVQPQLPQPQVLQQQPQQVYQGQVPNSNYNPYPVSNGQYVSNVPTHPQYSYQNQYPSDYQSQYQAAQYPVSSQNTPYYSQHGWAQQQQYPQNPSQYPPQVPQVPPQVPSYNANPSGLSGYQQPTAVPQQPSSKVDLLSDDANMTNLPKPLSPSKSSSHS